jgi:hypothetical protein
MASDLDALDHYTIRELFKAVSSGAVGGSGNTMPARADQEERGNEPLTPTGLLQ